MSLNVDAIAAMLAADPQVGPERAEVFKPHLPKLIEIVEQKGWMDAPVTLENVSEVTANFMEYIVEQDPEQDFMGLLTDMIGQLRDLVADRTQYVGTMTDAEVLPEHLNETAKALFANGELTLRRLIETNPAVMVPRS